MPRSPLLGANQKWVVLRHFGERMGLRFVMWRVNQPSRPRVEIVSSQTRLLLAERQRTQFKTFTSTAFFNRRHRKSVAD